MLQFGQDRKRGFTLIELAIVMAVAGLLFVGLWRLLAGGNQQVRDQSAASQQQQLISAVKAFLLTTGGQTFMAAQNPNASFNLPLPTSNTSVANCTANIAGAVSTFCGFLPSGFTTASVNSYGQTYSIQVLKDSAAANTPPNTYSFVILTVGGDIIPDTSGGRISAFVGGDGGFVYTANVCGAPANQMACGSYGTWTTNITVNYGFGAPISGHIATRTYASPSSDNTFPWLARPLMPGDNANVPLWNTMQTALFLGGQTFWLGSNNTLTTGGNNGVATGAINAQGGIVNMTAPGATTGGGTINMQGGIISDAPDTSDTGQIIMTAAAAGGFLTTNGVNPLVSLSTNCTADVTGGNPTLPINAFCQAALQVNGDGNFIGQLQAYDFYAHTFVYNASDARFKMNIHPLANALDSVMRLKPVTYTLKATGQENIGVIAQDVEKVYPQMVSDRGGSKAVAYDELIAPLIGAVQELKQENDRLRQQLQDQDARQKKLEGELRRKEAP